MLLYIALAVLGPLAVSGGGYCKRASSAPVTNDYGWDSCDENGLSCCYWIHNDTVIIYSHGFKDGKYHPNTHCEYIIDIDSKCDIHICYSMDFSMAGNDQISVGTKDVNIKYKTSKQPFDVNLNSNTASINFNTEDGDVKDGSKWAIGMVCQPKTEYKSVCEVCESIKAEMEKGPVDEEVIKVIS